MLMCLLCQEKNRKRSHVGLRYSKYTKSRIDYVFLNLRNACKVNEVSVVFCMQIHNHGDQGWMIHLSNPIVLL